MNFKNISALMFLCASATAFAGTGMGNGANWSQNNLVGNLAELVNPEDGVRMFNGTGVGGLIDQILPVGQDREIESIFFSYLKNKDPELAKMLQRARNSLTFYVVDDVKTVDTGLQVPQGFLQDSLAYQEFKTHRVYLRKKIRASEAYEYPASLTEHLGGVNAIGSFGLAFLRIHESYIRLGFDQKMNRIDAETHARQNIARAVSDPDFLRKVIQTVGIDYGSMSREQWLYAPEYTNDAQVILNAFLNFTRALSITCNPTSAQKTAVMNDYSNSTTVKSKLLHTLCGYGAENGPEVTRDFDTTYNWANTSLVSLPSHPPLPFSTLHYPANHQLFFKVQTVDSRCAVGMVEGSVAISGLNYEQATAKFQGVLNQWISLPVPVGVDPDKIQHLSITTDARADCPFDALAVTYLSTDPNSNIDETELGFYMFGSTPVLKAGSQTDYDHVNRIMSFDRFEVLH